MKTYLFTLIIVILTIAGTHDCFSKENRYNQTVEFGNPEVKGILLINGNGNIDITGYNGDKILVSSGKNTFREDEEFDEKAKGLKKIGGTGFNIVNNKKDNIIIIYRSMESIDLDIKVPNNIILKLGNGHGGPKDGNFDRAGKTLYSFFSNRMKGESNFISEILGSSFMGAFSGIGEGNVNIRDFSGTVEINVLEGNINAENFRGDIAANTTEGDIKIVFRGMKNERPLYLSTIEGDIDIELPANTKAEIMAKTMEGDVYSGFDSEVLLGRESEDGKGSSIPQNIMENIFQSNNVIARINGGGQKIYLSTIEGSIYIRKGK
jgi:hypothetical protein